MAEEPSIAVLVERISNVQLTVTDIKSEMATKEDQQHIRTDIARVERVLAAETANRIASVKDVADRLQLVEDRQEARKYQFGIAIALAVIGAFVGPIVGAVVK